MAEAEDDDVSDLASYTSDADLLFNVVVPIQESQVEATHPTGSISPPQSSPNTLPDVVQPFNQNADPLQLPGTAGTSQITTDATADLLFNIMVPVQESQVATTHPTGSISPPQSSPNTLPDVVEPFNQNAEGDIELCDHTLDPLQLPVTAGTSQISTDVTAAGTASQPTLSLPQEPKGSPPEENIGEQGARVPNT